MKQSRLAQRKLGIKPQIKLKKKKLGKRLYVFMLPCLILLAGLVFSFFVFSKWDGHSKISVAIQKESGDVEVVILDPAFAQITYISIPSDTQVQAANQLGTWRLGSITRLGQDKKIGQDFLKNTIVKSLGYPINADSNESFLNLTSGNLLKGIKALFSGRSSFCVFDKLKILFYSMQVGESSRFEVDLAKSSQLERAKLADNTLGYLIGENVPTNIISYFASDSKGERVLNLLINNGTKANLYALIVSKVVGVIGANVASIQNVSSSDIDCKVTGLSREVVSEIADVFSCEKNFTLPGNNFDIQIDLGKKFTERF